MTPFQRGATLALLLLTACAAPASPTPLPTSPTSPVTSQTLPPAAPTVAPPTVTLPPPPTETATATATRIDTPTATASPVPSATPTPNPPPTSAAPVATPLRAVATAPAGLTPTAASPATAVATLPPVSLTNGVLPAISARHKAIYQGSVAQGKDLRMFTIVGDCNSQPAVYLRRVVTGEFPAAGLPASLRATVDYFSQSFPRVSLAAGGGFTAAAMNDPVWADGALCGTTQTPFQCEVWVSRASVVFIQIGTGDQYQWQTFESHLRPLIEHALSKSVLPVLVTKADDLETRSGGAPPDFINSVVRRLAREYDVPLIDFWQATRSLPNNGLLDEGDLDFHLSTAGMDLHLRLTIEVLDAIRR